MELLTENEWVETRKHPGYGREMLAGILHLEVASEIVYSYHEYWDGLGYPRGLKADQIHVGAEFFRLHLLSESQTRGDGRK